MKKSELMDKLTFLYKSANKIYDEIPWEGREQLISPMKDLIDAILDLTKEVYKRAYFGPKVIHCEKPPITANEFLKRFAERYDVDNQDYQIAIEIKLWNPIHREFEWFIYPLNPSFDGECFSDGSPDQVYYCIGAVDPTYIIDQWEQEAEDLANDQS